MEPTLEKAAKTARAAVDWSGKKNLTCRLYQEYRNKFGGPSVNFIYSKMRWNTFKAKFLGIEQLSKRERMEKELNKNFCRYCEEKNVCNIELEDCDHWEYWKSQRNTG